MLDQLKDIVGAANVLTGDDMAKWRVDWMKTYSADPIAVLRPSSTKEVSKIMALAHETATPVVPVGGNTGLTGATSGKDMLMISLDRMNKIVDLDASGRTITVEAGVILSKMHDAADAHDLIFPLTFGAKGTAMIGGNLATNAGGSNVVRYGNTRDLCMGMEIVLADGRVMDLMTSLHKDNSGFNLRHLMIGAEGTLGIITKAVMKLFPKPRAYATATLAVTSLDAALDLLNEMQAATGGAVEAFEYMPAAYFDRFIEFVPGATKPFDQDHEVNILIEVGATADADAILDDTGQSPVVARLESALEQMFERGVLIDAVIAQNEAQRRAMWERREAAGEFLFMGGPFVNTDIAVPLPQVSEFLTRATERLKAIDPEIHEVVVSHLGDGNIHHTAYITRNDPDHIDAITEAIEDVAQELNGSFSAEHGVGKSKLNTMRRRKDPVALDAMRAIKAALDPKGILNPGKVIPD